MRVSSSCHDPTLPMVPLVDLVSVCPGLYFGHRAGAQTSFMVNLNHDIICPIVSQKVHCEILRISSGQLRNCSFFHFHLIIIIIFSPRSYRLIMTGSRWKQRVWIVDIIIMWPGSVFLNFGQRQVSSLPLLLVFMLS